VRALRAPRNNFWCERVGERPDESYSIVGGYFGLPINKCVRVEIEDPDAALLAHDERIEGVAIGAMYSL
jgi:hypothetical protein